jgi:hypothetical protein
MKSMAADGDSFFSAFSPAEQQEGFIQYYFVVSQDDPEVGSVETRFPPDGERHPYSYSVMDAAKLHAALSRDLFKRTAHTPVAGVKEGGDCLLTVTVKDAAPGTYVTVVCARTSDPGKEAIRIDAVRKGGVFTALIPGEEIERGVNAYYCLVGEKRDFGASVEITLPEKAPAGMYQFSVIHGKASLYDRIHFTQLKNVRPGKPLPVDIRIDDLPDDAAVTLKYRAETGPKNYATLEMKRKEDRFTAEIPAAALVPGKTVFYLFQLTVDKVIYPLPKDNLPAFSFTVGEKSKEDDKSREDKLKDDKPGDDKPEEDRSH